MVNRIIVIDDNREICEVIKLYGTKLGIKVDVITDSRLAIAKLKSTSYDIIILDVAMPGENGFDLFPQIRSFCATPILFLSARVQIEDRITGLKLGAEDYIIKPFSLEELFIKIDIINDRINRHELIRDDFHFWLDRNLVEYQGRELKLTAKSYSLLLLLVRNKNRVVERRQILDEVWGYSDFIDSRTIDTHIREIRKELGTNVIKTLRSRGYTYEVN